MKKLRWIAVLTALCGVTAAAAALVGCAPDEQETVKWTVSFDSNGGSEVASVQVDDGGKVAKPEDPVKENSAFDKWYSDESLQTEWSFENGVIFADKTLYAGWLDTKLTLTFDSNGGTAVDAVKFVSGGKIEEPTAPRRNGYDFDGWYNGDKKWNFASDAAADDLTLTAKWNKKQNVKITKETPLNLAEGQYNIVSYDGSWIDGVNVDNFGEVSITLAYQAEIPGDYGLYVSAAKEWNNAKLSAFKVEVNGEKQDTVRMAPSGDWNKAINSNIIKVALKEGTNVIRLTVDTDLVDRKEDAAEKIKAVTLLDVYPEYDYMPAGGAYIYRDGIQTEAEFGGKYENAYLSTSDGDRFTVKLNVERAGNYDFSVYAARPTDAGDAAWWVTVNGEDVYETAYINGLADQNDRMSSFKLQPKVNIALKAGENEITFAYAEDVEVSEQKYLEIMWFSAEYSENQSEKALVSFGGEGTEGWRPVSVNVGNAVLKPADPVSDGKFFAGWEHDGEPYDFSASVTGPITLTATYKDSVTVTFVGEPNVEAVEVAIGRTIDESALSYAGKVGYTVKIWSDAQMTVPYDFSKPVEGALTLYASYEAIVYDEVTSTKLDWNTATYENVSFDGEKIDWGQDNGSVSFKYTVDGTGEYGFYLEYARDIGWESGNYRKPQYCVEVNGGEADQKLVLTPTTGWGDACLSNVIKINLNAGENTIVLSTVVKTDNVDYLAHIRGAFVTDGYPEYGVMPQNIQAAGGTLSGCNSQYGGKFVDFDNENAYVETQVSALGGNYSLSLMYAGGFSGTATVEVFVNGESAGTIEVNPTDNRDAFALTEGLSVNLAAGTNTVKVVLKTSAGNGNFDLSALRITDEA